MWDSPNIAEDHIAEDPFEIVSQTGGSHWERPDLLQSPEMARPGISTKNTEKLPLGPKFWTPGSYPENTPKIPKTYPQKYPKCAFLVFFRYSLGILLGFQNFGPGGIFFRCFLWKFWVGPSRGSVAGRGVLKDRTHFAFFHRVSRKYRWDTPLWEGIAPRLRMLSREGTLRIEGGPCWDTQNPIQRYGVGAGQMGSYLRWAKSPIANR